MCPYIFQYLFLSSPLNSLDSFMIDVDFPAFFWWNDWLCWGLCHGVCEFQCHKTRPTSSSQVVPGRHVLEVRDVFYCLVVNGYAINFLDFPQKFFSGFDHHPNWRSHIFQDGVAQPPTSYFFTMFIYFLGCSAWTGKIFLGMARGDRSSRSLRGEVWNELQCLQ